MWKFVLVGLLGFALAAKASDDDATVVVASENNRHEFTPEEECSAVGGICMAKHDCPEGRLAESGNCPKQKSLGAVCCHDQPLSETRCANLGGFCAKTCKEATAIARANDCPVGESCCPLV